MAIKLIHESTLTSIADAIRSKTSTSAPISVEAFPSAISNIQAGIDTQKIVETGLSGGDIPFNILASSFFYVRKGALWGQSSVSIDIGQMVGASGTLRYSIGTEAFAGTAIMNTSNFPINDSYIEIGAFKNCTFSSGVFTVIPGRANKVVRAEVFKNSNLPYFEFPSTANLNNAVGAIETEAFANCSISYFSVNKDMTGFSGISDKAFYNCKKLKSFSIGSSVQNQFYIGKEAFAGCSSLTSFNIPIIKRIEERAFYSCKELISFSFNFPETIGSYAFAGCSKFIVPNGNGLFSYRMNIGDNAFESCKLSGWLDLTNYSIGDTAYTVGKNIFKNATVTNLSIYNFYRCAEGYFTYFFNGANISFSQYGEMPCVVPEGFFANTIINKSTYSTFTIAVSSISGIHGEPGIRKRAFYNASFVPSATISINARDTGFIIGEQAFQSCKNLIVVTDGATYGYSPYKIERQAFMNCPKLNTFNFTAAYSHLKYSGSYCTIEEEAFKDCASLRTFKMMNIGLIGKNAFQGCTSMDFTIRGDQVPFLADPISYSTTLPSGTTTFYVPSTMIDKYLSAPGWSSYFIMAGISIQALSY